MRRATTIAAAGGLLAAALLASTPVAASPLTPALPAQTAGGPYSGGGLAELLAVDASLAGTAIVDVDLTPASTDVDSAATPRSTATVANLSGDLLGAVPLDGILSEATQTAPPDNATPLDAVLLDVPVDPLLNLDVSSATAHARWPGDGSCLPPGTPISRSVVQTAGANVLEIPGFGQLVSVENSAGGVTATESKITTELVEGQTGRALQSQSSTQVTSVILFKGSPAEISIDVASTPVLTATATGAPGGATADFTAPVVNITTPADSPIPDIPLINLVPLDQLGGLLDQVTDGLEDVIDQTLGGVGIADINFIIGEETVVVDAAADGTAVTATAAAIIIEVTLLEAIGEPLVDATIAVAPLAANALVPAGGIVCLDDPLRDLHKDVSQADVKAGSTFDYTLTVPNRGPCVLEDVVVTDTITGPFSSISVEQVDPPATVDGGVITWNLGDLAVNETRTLNITVTVADSARAGETFRDLLRATGTCNGEEKTREVVLELPRVSNGFVGPCDLSLSNKSASHLEVTPGQTFNYFVHAFNRGAEACTGTTVTDTLDDRLSFVSCTDGCTDAGQTVTWSNQTIPGGGGATLVVTVQVADDATGELANTAVIDSPEDDGPPVTVSHRGPQITQISVLAPPNPPSLVGIIIDLPRTGADLPLLALVGVAAVALLGLGIRRRVVI